MPVQCLIRERDGGWLLLIRRGCEITLAERCRSDDAALRRADEIWRGFKERGFTEQRH
jgi:hypothetical protein